MRDGRLIMTAEKRQPGFYQLAGRRMNLDGGDYHPLFGQRATVGFNQFTDVVELSDKNLAAIMSERGAAHGAGHAGLDQPQYRHRSAQHRRSRLRPRRGRHRLPESEILPALHPHLDNAATGKLAATQGAYRSPAPLPNGDILVSYAANVVALDSFSGNFDIVIMNASTGDRQPLPAVVNTAQDELWPAAIYPRASIGIFTSRLDEANGATQIVNDDDPPHRFRDHVRRLQRAQQLAVPKYADGAATCRSKCRS